MTATRIADQLRQARRARFVGRVPELELFARALRTDAPEFSVCFVYGPGGIGKTTLLAMFADLAAAERRPVIRLDARTLDGSPPGFRAAAGEPVAGSVLLLDTYERLAPLDDWLRDTYLPSLPAGVLVVIAGRHPPPSGWLTDPGWAALLRVIALRNLRPAESRAYLSGQGVADAWQESVIAFTHGHPLALALVADMVRQGEPTSPAQLRPEQEPDVVRVLLERFVSRLPSPQHRAALECCAHVRVTTEALVAQTVGGDDPAALFDWLRGLSFIEHSPEGVFPHDLARAVLDADLRWRNPDRYRQLHTAARAEIVRRIQTSRGVAQQRALFDFLFMHRGSAVTGRYHHWETLGQAYAEPATGRDLGQILAMVDRYEGGESAGLAERWYGRQPAAFSAFRDLDGRLIGFEATLALHDAAPADAAADPAAQAALAYARRHRPLRAGDELIYHRFHIGDDYQVVSPATNLFAMSCCRHWLTRSQLAWSFVAVADPDYWWPLFSHLNFQSAHEAAFEVGGRRYAVYAHDWRAEPAGRWYELMGERELMSEPAGPPAQPDAVPLVVLSEPEFGMAVRRALRDYTRPEALAASPLLRSRVVVDRAGPRPSPAALQALLREAAETLRANPRDDRLYRALHRTYLEPAPTQERAAERLGLPFSTYRHHLTGGIERLTQWLWRRELSGPAEN